MKKILFFMVLSCTLTIGFSQSWISSSKIDGSDDVSIIKSDIDPDNSIITLGAFFGSLNTDAGDLNSFGLRDLFVASFLEDGTTNWVRQIGSAGMEFLTGGVGVNAAGEVYVTGGFQQNVKFAENDSLISNGMWDIFLAKYDNTGNLLWYKNIGTGAALQVSTSLKIDISGDVLVSGIFRDSVQIDETTTLYADNSFNDYFYAKFEPTAGDLLWVKQIQAISDSKAGFIYEIEEDSDGYLMAGVYADSILIEDDTLVSLNKEFDIHLISTDVDGNVNWIRNVKGTRTENTYAVAVDQDDNVFLTGYYLSTALTIDSTATDTIRIEEYYGNYDLLMAKYDKDGVLQWAKTAGGPDNDYIWDATIYNNRLQVAGSFKGEMQWGGIHLQSPTGGDTDAFLGSLEMDGSFRNARNYYGNEASSEEMLSIFFVGDDFYTVMRSNSDLITLDKPYLSTTGKFYLLMGVVGCPPVYVDNVDFTEMVDCTGDSTGTISITASSEFGGPFQYSIDNGDNYSNNPLYNELPAGEYQVVVLDAAQCDGIGPLITIGEPDPISIQTINMVDSVGFWKTFEFDGVSYGSWEVAASGGSGVFTFTLYPEVNAQAIGNFTSITDTVEHFILVNDSKGCGPVSTDTIEFTAWINLDDGIDAPRALDASIYPNPTRSLFTIELEMDADEVQMEILSLTGQIVRSSNVYTSNGLLRETVDVSDLAAGMYMLRLNGRSVNSRIVVQ